MAVLARYASSRTRIRAGICGRSRLAGIGLAAIFWVVAAFPRVPWAASVEGTGTEGIPPAPPPAQIETTNVQQVVRAYVQLQEQLRATQLALEQNRQETKAASAKTTETLSNALQTIQEAMVRQRAQDLAATRELNRKVLITAGGLAATAFLTTLLIACFQWHLSKGLAEMSAALPAILRLGSEVIPDALGSVRQPRLRRFGAAEVPEDHPHGLVLASHRAVKHHRGSGWSIEKLLFPKPGDSLRRRQFRALRTALLFGLLCAAVLGLVLYLLHSQPTI